MRFLFPCFGCGAGFFYVLVFFAGVPLAGRLHKTGIHHFPLFGKNIGSIKRFVERGEQAHDYIFLYQLFPKVPECFAVGYFVTLFKSQKTLETCPVRYLVFQLVVRKVVKALNKQGFKKHQLVERGAATFRPVFCLRVGRAREKNLAIIELRNRIC